jgi:GNAT superfamily N-acetyltransferase
MSRMSWHITHDLEEFESRAGALLRSGPAEHTVALSICAALRSDLHTYGPGDPVFGWWQPADGAEATGALIRTPPHQALLGPLPDEAVQSLAELLAGGELGISEVSLRITREARFTDAWQRASGRAAEVAVRERLFRLGELTPRDPAPPGAARIADETDRELLIRWFTDFRRVIGVPEQDPSTLVDRRIAAGNLLLWEVDGKPVSLAGHTAPQGGTGRIGPVYTPPEHERNGYGAAVTAAASSRVRSVGAEEVVLFTDLANPVSNSVYQRIGYLPVHDQVQLALR